MSDNHSGSHGVQEHMRSCITVFVVLLIFTIITVAISYVDFGNDLVNIGIGLLIATFKAFLVAAYFMHLISEKKLVYTVLTFTGVFFVGLMFLTLFSYADIPTTGNELPAVAHVEHADEAHAEEIGH